jgi:hypothetical protein
MARLGVDRRMAHKIDVEEVVWGGCVLKTVVRNEIQ